MLSGSPARMNLVVHTSDAPRPDTTAEDAGVNLMNEERRE